MPFPATALVTKPLLPATNPITRDCCSSRILPAGEGRFQSPRALSQQAFTEAQTGRLVRQQHGGIGVQITLRAACRRHVHRFGSSSWHRSLQQVTTLSSLWSTALRVCSALYPNLPDFKELQVYKTTPYTKKMENTPALCNLTRRLVWGFWMRLACAD